MGTAPSVPEETDAVVVGGGIAGTSTAFFLASETEADVTLIEKDGVASGSTGDSSAILRHHYGGQEIYAEMARWSHEFYRNFEEQVGERIARADNPLVRFAEEGTEAAAYAMAGYDVLSALDIPVERYDRSEFDDRYPMLSLGEFDLAVSDETAGYSDGSDAANGFARAAREHGATVVTGTAVTDVAVEDGAVAGVETDDGPVRSDAVVIAAGPWTPRLAERAGVDVPITVEREQVVVLDPPEGFEERYPDLTPTTALPGGRWYIRPDFGGGILVATHHTGEEVDPDAYDGRPDEETLLDLTGKVGEFIPELADAGVRGGYCGVYSTTPDHDFVLDGAGPDGCYLACGFSGHGFKHGPAVGRVMADLVTTGTTALVDVEFFSLDRFEEDPAGHGLPEDLA